MKNISNYLEETKKMKSRKGFTLIEVMVVVLIVSILAAVLVPLLTARIEAARWSEGKAGAGMLATAIRAYAAETQENTGTLSTNTALYIPDTDLDGKYFKQSGTPKAYVINSVSLSAAGVLSYSITVTAPTVPAGLFTKVPSRTLTQAGIFTPP